MQVLILDPHPIMADAIAQVVHRAASSANTVQVATLAALKASLKKEEPALIIAEPNTSFGPNFELLQLLESGPTPFLLYSGGDIPDEHEPPGTAIGAFLSKSKPVSALLAMLVKALNTADEVLAPTAPLKLSKRQRQLLIALDKGKSNKDIALDFNISEYTVQVHFWRLYKRLGVNSRTLALSFARTNGWL